MWLMIDHAIADLHRSSLSIKLFWGVLLLVSSFSLGSLGGFSIQAIKMKWTTLTAPIPFSGSAFGSSTIPSLSSMPSISSTDTISTIRKSASEPSNIEAIDGKP